MAFKRFITLLVAVMFILPSFVTADDFEDDFGGGGGSGGGDDFAEDDFGSFEEEKKEEEPFDAEESAEKKEKEDQKKSDEAMRDLLGEEEPREEEKKKEEEKKDDFGAIEPVNVEPVKEEKKTPAGLKPVLLVKGGFTLLGQYRQKNGATTSTLGSMFGSVDEGLLGAEYDGEYVIAKGTMNIRTENPLINKSNNPLMINNLHSIQNGFMNGLYELYGGMKFYGVFVKAGKMIPEYGLLNTFQKLGMGFSTPFLTRALNVVEGYIPETDAGFALGYENTFAKAHTIHLGLMLGTGSNNSAFWNSDKTMGLYAKLAYMHKIFQFGFGLQYRKDYDNSIAPKELPVIGIGVHANVSVKGFEMPLTFDFNQMSLLLSGAKKTAQSILLSVAPGYAYSFNSKWADKIALAIRFDLSRGVYIANTNYLDYATFKNTGMYYRIGATVNFFAKEAFGVHSYAGITFLMQPESKVVSTPSQIDYGFTTLMLSAGAEF